MKTVHIFFTNIGVINCLRHSSNTRPVLENRRTKQRMGTVKVYLHPVLTDLLLLRETTLWVCLLWLGAFIRLSSLDIFGSM